MIFPHKFVQTKLRPNRLMGRCRWKGWRLLLSCCFRARSTVSALHWHLFLSFSAPVLDAFLVLCCCAVARAVLLLVLCCCFVLSAARAMLLCYCSAPALLCYCYCFLASDSNVNDTALCRAGLWCFDDALEVRRHKISKTVTGALIQCCALCHRSVRFTLCAMCDVR